MLSENMELTSAEMSARDALGGKSLPSPAYIIKHLLFNLPMGGSGILTQEIAASQVLTSSNSYVASWLLEDANIQDGAGWYVIDWLSHFRRLTKLATIQKELRASNAIDPAQLLTLSSPDLLYAYCDELRSELGRVLAPGALFSQSHDVIYPLVSFLPAQSRKDPRLYAVFRYGVFMRRAAGRQSNIDWAKRIRAFTSLPLELINKLPLTLRLLYAALISAAPQDAYSRWGILWTKRGLGFYPLRAYKAVSDTPSLKFLIEATQPYMAAPEYSENASLPHSSLKLSRLWMDRTQAFTHLARESVVYNTYAFEYGVHAPEVRSALFSADNAVLFPYDSAKSLFKYTDKLVATHKRSTEKAIVKAEKAKANNPSVKPWARSEKLHPVMLRTCDWGYYSLDASHFCEWHRTRYGGEVYLSIPSMILDRLPQIGSSDLYGNHPQRTLRTPASEGDVFSAYAPLPPFDVENTVRHVVKDGRVFLHPLCFLQGGEFQSLVDELLNKQPRLATNDLKQKLNAFSRMCAWLLEPERFPTYPLGFDQVVNKEWKCPVYLDTYEERLEYLKELSLRSLYTAVAYVPLPSDGGKDIRSLPLRNYEKFAIWYVTHHETVRLPYRLRRGQLYKYISYRWLRWRRPDSLASHVGRARTLNFEDFPQDRVLPKPLAPKDLDMDQFVEEMTASGFGNTPV